MQRLARDGRRAHPPHSGRKIMTGPTEHASEVVLTINTGRADLDRGKLAVTIHLLTYLTERIHGS